MRTLTENLIIPVITSKIFLKKVTTNTPSQRAQLDIALGNYALSAQSLSLIESDHIFLFGDLTGHISPGETKNI